MSGKTRRPSFPPPTSSHSRTRGSSLSIARSPSVLSTITITSPTHIDLESEGHHIPNSFSHTTHTLERTYSHPPASYRPSRSKSIPTLSGIPSDEDLATPDEERTLPHKVVTFDEEDQVREYEDEESDTEERIYTGAFQPPDSRELLGILLSVGGVAILAVAAGLTTIFDWVL